MKVNSINLGINNLSFKGFAPAKNERGYKTYEFNFPFDENNFDCYLELFNVEKDRDSNYRITDIIQGYDADENGLKMKSGPNVVNLTEDYFIPEGMPFAYHYKLVSKNGGDPSYHVDAGNVIDSTYKGPHEIYNVVSQNGSNLSHGGSMKLVVLDNFKVGEVYNPELFSSNYIIRDEALIEKAKKANKNFSNKMGGTLAGLEKAIDEGKLDGYSSIISLPIFTDDSLSAHAYWNKNNMQIAQSLGNINNYASLQRKMFAKGMNFVSDGAFVNEGLEGIHFANVLKWGQKSPYYNWFNISGFPLTLGVFGKNQEFISHKVVNSPYDYEQQPDGTIKVSKNSLYNSKKPTYIQIFDKRLASESQKNDKEHLIKAYDILDTENPYDINTHNDTVVNYSFEIDPETYHKNILNLSEYNKFHVPPIKIDDINGTRFLSKFGNFELEDKIESNIETWDANTDILKLNYVDSHAVTEDMKNIELSDRDERAKLLHRNNIEVQDYTITSGAFWTQKTKDILTLYAAQNLKDIVSSDAQEILDKINNNIDNKIFPKRIKGLNIDVIKNVINGKYNSNRKFSFDSYEDQVKMGLMNLPLDSIEFGDNLAGVLASPYISKRATSDDQIGVSKYDLYKQGNPHVLEKYKRGYEYTQKMYEQELEGFALNVLKDVEGQLSHDQKFSEGNQTSLYGKYVLPLLTSEIAKFAVIKALQPDAKVYVDEESGEIGYDYDALKEVSLETIGIFGASPEDEAISTISKVRSGILKISDADKKLLVDALVKSIKGTSVESFALADMIVERSEAGLDWRIDAAKDIGNMDSLRNGNTDFDFTWKQVSAFWEKFNNAILEINPNAYLVAELTNEYDLHRDGNGVGSHKYNNDNDVRRKFIDDTGLTALANYRYFFTDIAKIFGKSFEDGTEMSISDLPTKINEIMVGNDDYLRSSNLNSLNYSYTFIDNHDKPRALHTLALDMDLFYIDLTDKNRYDFRERAFKLLNDRYDEKNPPTSREINNFDFSRVSAKSVAMGEAMRTAFIDTLNELSSGNQDFASKHEEIFKTISHAITDMANGRYLGDNIEADAFAVKPFDVTINSIIKQMQYRYKEDQLTKDGEKYRSRRLVEPLLTDEQYNLLAEKTFERIMRPAMSKLLGIMKFLVALPGKPTLYAGDDLGATGYESKTKNIYMQNRGYVHNEWLEDPSKNFIKDYYDEINEVMALRSRPELDALNNGTPFMLPIQNASNGGYKTQISAMLRQNVDGKMAISLFNTAGINHNPKAKYEAVNMYLDEDRIYLSDINNKKGGHGINAGLKDGTRFVNANDLNDVYYVHKYGNEYVLEHGDRSPICINDTTMVLYHVPEKSQVSFTGKINFKPAVGSVLKAYEMV